MMLDTLHHALRVAHISVGFVGLAVFWIPIFSKKGGRLHVVSGKLFVACGYFLVASGLFSCSWALVHPWSFANLDQISAERAAELAHEVRFFFSILLVLSNLVLVALVIGIRVIKTRREPEKLDSTLVRGVCWFSGVVCFAGAMFGIYLLRLDGNARNWVLIVLGLLGAWDGWGQLRFVRNHPASKMAWWYKHMECMMGCGIAFYTAFFVFGFSRLVPIRFEGMMALLPWVLPSVIGVPASGFWVRKYQRKFGDLPMKTVAQESV